MRKETNDPLVKDHNKLSSKSQPDITVDEKQMDKLNVLRKFKR